MTTSPAQAFWDAEEAALRGSAELLAAMGTLRLYDETPTNAPLPYVVKGEHQIIQAAGDDDCADEATIFDTIQWWSKTNPPDKGAQARAMGAIIIGLLTAQLNIAGWDCVVWEIETETYTIDPDGSTHGNAVIRYELTELT